MSVISGIVGPSMAADAQAEASAATNKTQTDIYNKNVELNQPFYNQGLAALPYMNEFTGVKTPYNVPMPKTSDFGAPGTAGFMEQVPVPGGQNDESGNPQMTSRWNPGTPGVTDQAAYDAAMEKWKVGKAEYDASVSAGGKTGLPTYEDTVTKPMESWQFDQSPAYKAKYSLGMEELNKQLQARGLGSSGVGATRAADLARNLTASDYNSERFYKQGGLQDLYKSRYSENTDRYNRLLDQVKMGTGASSSMGQAGNNYATGISNANTQAGNAQASFYSGLGGYSTQNLSTGLKAYDYGNKQGWWGQGAKDAAVTQAGADAAVTAYAPEMAADYGALYGL